MKKKLLVGLAVGLLVFGLASGARATLTTVGTATYDSDGNGTTEEYNLIYDADSPFGPITWLDYTNEGATWQNQVNWASGLGANLTVSLSGYTSANDWTTGWRLPSTVDGPNVIGYDGTTNAGFNITNSEMGQLYYTALGNKGYYDTSGKPQSGWSLTNKGLFAELKGNTYWSDTEYAATPYKAWYFDMYLGDQGVYYKDYYGFCGLVVRPGQVSPSAPIPEPATMLLFGSGLAGLAGSRLRSQKRISFKRSNHHLTTL